MICSTFLAKKNSFYVYIVLEIPVLETPRIHINALCLIQLR